MMYPLTASSGIVSVLNLLARRTCASAFVDDVAYFFFFKTAIIDLNIYFLLCLISRRLVILSQMVETCSIKGTYENRINVFEFEIYRGISGYHGVRIELTNQF